MKRTSPTRRLLLQMGVAALLGLAGRAAFADILDAASSVSPEAGGDGLAAAQSRLGESLLHYLAAHRKPDGNANLIVSPASLAAILSFVDLGANQSLCMAIHRSLSFNRVPRGRLEDDLKALRDVVSTVIQRAGGDGALVLANLLAFDRSSRPKRLALLGLSGAGADVLVDSLGDPRIIERINGWVKQKTRDLIPSVIEEAPESLGLIAVNALYFKDRWQTPFDRAQTRPDKFQTVSGNAVDVMMMHSPVGRFSFRQDDRFIAVDLGYTHDDYRLVVVTTRSAPAALADFAAAAAWLGGQGFAMATGEIALPKLSLSAAEELLAPLDALGLRAARQKPDALEQFSDEALVITRIVQKLELRLSEEGTEAAVASAVVTMRSLGLPDHVRMTVDKPFLFALRDRKSGLVLLTGYVGTPPQKV